MKKTKRALMLGIVTWLGVIIAFGLIKLKMSKPFDKNDLIYLLVFVAVGTIKTSLDVYTAHKLEKKNNKNTNL